jgi:hypothetical protein
MKTRYQSLLVSITALALAGTAYAQVPSTNDKSDGNSNTGMGTGALGGPAATNNGSGNTASGYEALYSNSTGSNNTASGYVALHANTTGIQNTASGTYALYSNTAGNSNTASGVQALNTNTTGSYNGASGYAALYANTTGSYNSASGYAALYANTTGRYNSASGAQALYVNKTGGGNTASGYAALYANTSGHYNIAEGYKAGFNLKTGSNNIDIGNPGESTDGVAADSGVIRIGTQTPTALQTVTYIAGIYDNTSVSGLAVVIDSNGQLGTVSSSERFKTAIAPMGSDTAKLERLRPVTFQYKADRQGTLRYGLIAEEVAKVYPELVVLDKSGRIDGVRYDELAPMLLNEVQQQAATIRDLKQQLVTQSSQLRSTQQQVTELQDLKQELHAALAKLQSKSELVAQR